MAAKRNNRLVKDLHFQMDEQEMRQVDYACGKLAVNRTDLMHMMVAYFMAEKFPELAETAPVAQVPRDAEGRVTLALAPDELAKYSDTPQYNKPLVVTRANYNLVGEPMAAIVYRGYRIIEDEPSGEQLPSDNTSGESDSES